jgi:hypothetical protein
MRPPEQLAPVMEGAILTALTRPLHPPRAINLETTTASASCMGFSHSLRRCRRTTCADVWISIAIETRSQSRFVGWSLIEGNVSGHSLRIPGDAPPEPIVCGAPTT